MGFWPYCSDAGAEPMECLRGSTLAVTGALTALLMALALRKIWPVWAATRWFGPNLVMLALGLLQTLLSTLNYALLRDYRVAFTIKFVHGVQISLTCLIYGRLALESVQRPHLIRRALHPLIALLLAYMVTIFVVHVTAADVDCRHPTFVLMSLSSMLIAVGFAVAGCRVLAEIRDAAALQVQYTELLAASQTGLDRKNREIWILIVVNAVSSVLQLALDVYLLEIDEDRDCRLMVEDYTSSEEVLQLFLSLLSFSLPEWALYFVFYWAPRRQFETGLDLALPEGSAQELEFSIGEFTL